MNHAVLLAKSGEAVKAGPIGLAVILLLCIACYFLFKSMSRHMREVRENFPSGETPTVAPAFVPADVQRAEIIRTDPAATKPALAPPSDDEPSPPARGGD